MSESAIDAGNRQRCEQLVASTFSESFAAKPALERLDILEETAAVLFSAAESSHDVPALRQVVDLCERAVQAAPVESVRHGLAVYNLFSGLGTLYAWTREHALRQRAAELAKTWLDSPEAPRDGREPQYVLSVGSYLYRVALATSQEKDIDAAVQVLEGARSLVKPGTPVDCIAAAFLADMHLDQYRRTSIPTELQAAIELSAIPIASKRSRIEVRQLGLKVFSRATVWAYEELSDAEDLELALNSARTGMQEATTDRDRMEFLSVIATALRCRFRAAQRSEDLDEAIDAYKRLIAAAGDDRERALSLDNCANGLADRYELQGNLADLRTAVDMSRRALQLLATDSPDRGRVLANLGRSLLSQYLAARDATALAEAIDVLRRGVEAPTKEAGVNPRLHNALGEAYLHQAAQSSAPGSFLREALNHFAHARSVVVGRDLPLKYSMAARERLLSLVDKEIGALLWLATVDAASAPTLLGRALEIGEAIKSSTLASAMARTAVARPDGVPQQLLDTEAFLLGNLSALENAEISGVLPSSHRVLERHRSRREDLQSALESVWEKMKVASAEGAEYVRMRRNPHTAWVEVVHRRSTDTAFVSLLPIRDVRASSRFQVRGLAALALRPGVATPTVLASVIDEDVVAAATLRFSEEILKNRGDDCASETWYRELSNMFGGQTPSSIAGARTLVLSPPRHGHDLPWHLALQRAGWRAPDDGPMPVTILPTFAALRDPTQTDVDRHGEGDLLTPRIPWVDVHSREEALRTVLRMAGEAGTWSGPLIIGNPSGDLDSAENEAATVATLLGVTPLVREQATVERVLGALDHADIIHLATHAWFDADDPLDSSIELADGTIKARDLVKAHSRAKLVVLSACESAASQRLVGGEVAGLAHALLRAGSQAIVAGLWLVEDAAGAFLMEAFYRDWLENGDPAVSLSRAQRLTSEQLSWQHPYFWSGFILLRSA